VTVRVVAQVKHVGERESGSDGCVMDANGILYFGLFSKNAVVAWDSSTPFTPANHRVLAESEELMQVGIRALPSSKARWGSCQGAGD
jgi:hypothetical protein